MESDEEYIMILLKKKYIGVLKKCLEHFRKDLLWVIESDKVVLIDQEIGNQLREAVGDELIEYGFVDDSPNEYGRLLEDLIDVIGAEFLSK